MKEKELEKQLLSITYQFLQESRSLRASRALSIESALEKDLGIGSLEKAELFHRIERQYKVQLPESLYVSSRTLIDIKNALITLSNSEKIDYKKTKIIETYESQNDLSEIKTLLDILISYKNCDSDRPYLYLQQENEEQIITYGELFDGATRLAAGLQKLKVGYGDTVAIMLPTGADFFFAFYGILLAGAIPVPIYPPLRADQIEEYAHKEAKILHNAGVKILISFQAAKNLNRLLGPFVPTLLHVKDVPSLMSDAKAWQMPDIEEDDIALLQYTSGSTGNPKGVTLTHANLIANIKAYGQGAQVRPDDVVVSWLPLYHDMGLIGTVLGCLYYGLPLILMSPLAFLARPQRWFWAIHYRRATMSAAPNFAYELCAKKIKDKDIDGIDLSCWRLAFNGAEAIYPKTLQLFYDRFKKYGLRKNVFFPVYGLAESSVALTFPPVGREPLIDRIDKQAFEKEQKAVAAAKDSKNYYEFVSCGLPLANHKVRIVDDRDNELPERSIGNLQFCGPSAMQGYYRNSESTEAVYHDGWWASGDLAYIANAEIYITGRKKDLIIKAGRNYYPQEIEDIASDVDGIRKGCVAAFGVIHAQSGTEKLIVVAEKSARDNLDLEKIIDEINLNINDKIGIPPDDVVLVEPKTIPKTSSGKLRRSACKKMYLDLSLSKSRKAVWLQVTQLFLAGVSKRSKRFINLLGKALYTSYVATVFIIIFTPVRLATYFLSRNKAAKLIQKTCKLLTIMSFCPIKCVGTIPQGDKPKIFVANHTSYVDPLLLITVLPINTRFVVKKEVMKVPVLGRLLKKLGHIFIDRVDITKNTADLHKVMQEISHGHPVLFFPEGTFTRVSGVRPFKSGSFQLSVQEQIAIHPIALKNSRGILRANSPFFSPRKVVITFLQPKMPHNRDWEEIAILRDYARKEISRYCGEDPIDLITSGVEKVE